MGSANSRFWFFVLLSACLLPAYLPAIAGIALADDHGKGRGYYANKERGREFRGAGKSLRGKRDEGNETTGQITAWSLGVANFTVALSVLIRGIKRFVPLSPELKGSLVKFNNAQKKHLMWFHYALNPLILGMAVIHYSLSRCCSTALPEWGLLTMGAIVGLGIVLKFRLCPKSFLRNVYKLHTQPAILLVFISMLLIGHMIVD
ncbi:MAG: hypothetical protein AB9866_02145 [Syntrophobacteraceae bacterium]